jgi:hypothetical protein
MEFKQYFVWIKIPLRRLRALCGYLLSLDESGPPQKNVYDEVRKNASRKSAPSSTSTPPNTRSDG